MAATLVRLDTDAQAQVFTFGTTSASGEALVTLNKGTAAATTVVLDVKGSATIAGDINVTGNFNVTGSINQASVTNLAVTDINITLNKGGSTAGAVNSGLFVEGDSAAVIGKLLYDGSLTSKWKIGDGTTQVEVVTVSGTQTLSNKTIAGSQITGNITGNAANVTGIVAVANGGTGLATLTSNAVILGNGTGNVTFVAPGSSGNVLTSNGSTWTSAAPSGSSTIDKWTTVSGTQDGANKTFTIGNALTADTEMVTRNGVVLKSGASNDYVISGTTLTFQAAAPAPAASDVIQVRGHY